jgi:beta-glucosidase
MGIKRREFLATVGGAAGMAAVPGAMAAKAVKGGVPVYRRVRPWRRAWRICWAA